MVLSGTNTAPLAVMEENAEPATVAAGSAPTEGGATSTTVSREKAKADGLVVVVVGETFGGGPPVVSCLADVFPPAEACGI